jgi:hypothetical protein
MSASACHVAGCLFVISSITVSCEIKTYVGSTSTSPIRDASSRGRALQIEPGKAKNEEKVPYRIYIADNEYIDAKDSHAAIVFFNCD